jgi:hypothetical protein
MDRLKRSAGWIAQRLSVQQRRVAQRNHVENAFVKRSAYRVDKPWIGCGQHNVGRPRRPI